MPLDPQSQALLDMMAQMNVPDFSAMTPESARALFDNFPRPDPPTAVADIQNRSVPGPGGEIPVRFYTPDSENAAGALLYFHGGGWVFGNLDNYDESCRQLAAKSGLTVIAADFRLAPETRFPGATEDCYAVTQWVAENSAALGLDPTRLAIGGDSTGGNLAAAVAQISRDRGGPDLRFQLLFYPVTDCNFETDSYRQNAQGYFLTRSSMQWFWDHYLPDPAERAVPYASPLHATEFAKLPPALVITAEYDPLRDEGEAYARALEQAGVDVVLTRYDGMMHGFLGFPTLLEKARQAFSEAAVALQNAMA